MTSGGTTPTLTDPELAPAGLGALGGDKRGGYTRRTGAGIDSTTRIASANGIGRKAGGTVLPVLALSAVLVVRIVPDVRVVPVVRIGGGGARTGRRLVLVDDTTLPGVSENRASEIILSRPDHAAILPAATEPAFVTVGLIATGCAEIEPAFAADAESASFLRIEPVPSSEARIILRLIAEVEFAVEFAVELRAEDVLGATERFPAGFDHERFA